MLFSIIFYCRLESLFYLDTPSKQASSKLVKPKPKEELPRRKEKSALSLYSRSKDTSNEDSRNEDGISTKTFSVQNHSSPKFFKLFIKASQINIFRLFCYLITKKVYCFLDEF